MAAAGVLELSDDTFQSDVLENEKPVLVDFWAPWCQPCRMIAPVVEAVATANQGKLVVGKLNIDDSPQTPSQYGVHGIPTLVVFKGGKEVQRIVGVVDKSVIQKAVDKAL